jgi:hypothetical protein
LEGVGTLAGVGLLVGRNDTFSHWAGTFMISTSASELFWEWIDRKHHLAHDHRLPRFALSAMTGMIVSNLLVLGVGGFRAGSLDDPGRITECIEFPSTPDARPPMPRRMA